MKRRDVLKWMGASFVALQAPSTFGSALPMKATAKKKLVWIVLRGALDSLHWIPPMHEKRQMQKLRPNLFAAISDKVLPLDENFALHPALPTVHQWYQEKQATPIVATYSGYGKRSHFEAQDYLERGGHQETNDDGWLARLVKVINSDSLAIARSTPISLRGEHDNLNWYPSNLPESDDGLFERLMHLYAESPILSERLAQGIALDEMTGLKRVKKVGRFPQLALSCGKLMNENPSVQVSMLELGGWDTHNQQAIRLSRRLQELDNGLKQLRIGLGNQWDDTLVVVATEFGRTAAENGTMGTDHGTASAILLAGGAVKGGNVLGDWPGLAPSNLYAGRDLKPTSNMYQWINTAVAQHFQLSDTQMKHLKTQQPLTDVSLIRTTVIA